MPFATGVDGCKFCDLAQKRKPEVILRDANKCVMVKDLKPKATHHYLAISKVHINKPTDLTAADIPLLEDMVNTGRELLRAELKAKGEADTVEDMLRIGFHWPPLVKVNHLHMHFLYPIKDMGMLSKMFVFRPGKVFHETRDVIEDLRQKAGLADPLIGNPCKDDDPETLPAHAVAN